MEISEDWKVFRIMISHGAFGKSGNLTSDIVEVCAGMELDAFIFEDAGGHNVKGEARRNYLFGGTPAAVPQIIEVVLPSDKLDPLKSKVVELLEAGDDNAAFYTLPVEGYIFNKQRID